MTESEALQAVAAYGDNAVTTFTVYLSVMFAYLAVAYLVGHKLTGVETHLASGLFVAADMIVSTACVASVQAWTSIVENYPTILNTIPLYTLPLWPYYMAVLLGIGIIVSLFFMYRIRRSLTRGEKHAPG